uniref:Uncharacterized protein n=1 Tax=Amphiprion percula TaxID=161767 RepID=A0A3P8T6F6_AMPPE
MASTSSFLSEEQFQCSICLDVFTEPVSIPCGHNFCLACLSRHWADKLHCQCPLCNEKFTKHLKLRVNIEFREVVENFKKHHADSPVKPGQVPCDYCPGNKIRASKTCLVCLTSYCETHLEPHHRVSSLKRHKLTNPVHKLEDKICQKHNRILEFLCRDDQTRVCSLCAEHSAHDTVPLEEEYVDKGAQMGKKNAEVHEIKHKPGKKGQKKASVQSKGKSKVEANSVDSNQKQDPFMSCFPNEGPQCVSEHHIPVDNNLSEGRFYYEAEAGRKTLLDLGLIRVLMYLGGAVLPDTAEGHWIIMLECKRCRAPLHIPVWINQPVGITLFVDHERGFVSFSNAGILLQTFTFNRCKFSQRLSLLFIPHVSWTQKLLWSAQTVTRSSGDFCYVIAFIFVLVCLFWPS